GGPFFKSTLAENCITTYKQPELKSDGKAFTAAIDQELTKTTLTNESKVYWESSDQININGAVYSATPDESDATKATFTKVSGSDPSSPYKAIYPASLYVTDHFEFPATQTYESGKLNAPMYATSTTESLSFKNICGVICFALKGTAKVKSIAVTANEPICGTFTIDTDDTSVILSGLGGKTVTLGCGSGVQLNGSTATNFYVYLPPKSSYTAGMKIVITATDGKVYKTTTTKAVTIARNNIYTFSWTPEFVAPSLPTGSLSGAFSVSDSKMVYFSQGNLTYDDSAFKFEANQYDFASSWDTSHVSHFYWSKTASVAYAESHSDSGASDDVFFTNTTAETAKSDFTVGGVQGKYRTLSTAEWQYLFNYDSTESGGSDYSNATRAGLYAYGVTVVDKTNCVVLYPDGFTGTKVSNGDTTSYDTAEEWAAAQNAGVVCLPAAGYRTNSGIGNVGSYGFYWSSSAVDSDYAYYVFFRNSLVLPVYKEYRFSGYSVRLVTEAE
ncbi:MAG: hypothetical protein Q4F39_05260, partial [Bacteroidia bacterium]|nr:hypothetical protein [Bacteroidia bacterium]